MPAFSPRSVINNMTGRTARRFFRFLDPSIQADWGDDNVFAPATAVACFDALDKERKSRFFLSLGAIHRIASSDANCETLRERLRAHGVAVPAAAGDITDAYDLAVDALVDCPDAWRETQYFVSADTLPERRWHLFDVETVVPDSDPTPAIRAALATAVRETWRRGSFDLGRKVEFSYALRDGRYEYYVAEVDDYPRDSREFTGTRFVSRLITPVCGIVLVYDRERRTLRVGTTVPLVKAPSIAMNWARVVKGASLHAARGEEVRPLIENLVDPDRELTLDPDGRIVSIRRSAIVATRFGKEDREISLKAHDPDDDALVAFREDIVGDGLTLADYIVHEVKLSFVLRTPAGRTRRATVTVRESGCPDGGLPNWVLEIVRERLAAWEVIDAVAA